MCRRRIGSNNLMWHIISEEFAKRRQRLIKISGERRVFGVRLEGSRTAFLFHCAVKHKGLRSVMCTPIVLSDEAIEAMYQIYRQEKEEKD